MSLGWDSPLLTGLLVLSDGLVISGYGVGCEGIIEGEVCFNTSMTGYQEILTDPSYAGQIVTFTFPHIGNVGSNVDDIETVDAKSRSGVVGSIFRECPTSPSNYRSSLSFSDWLKSRGIIGLWGVDTRALTSHIREVGFLNGVIAHSPSGEFDIADLKLRAKSWGGLEGCDLVPTVTTKRRRDWSEGVWGWSGGYDRGPKSTTTKTSKKGGYDRGPKSTTKTSKRIVAVDFGTKRNILRLFVGRDCDVTVVPSTTSAKNILSLNPDGIFLSNGPGDPAATGEYVVPELKKLLESGVPIFGICLGHQMLALALGGRTKKMHQGHHGANHPVKDLSTGKVEIVSMNHGFCVDSDSLPAEVTQTHVSLFDGSNCGLELSGSPVFSVQHHPEASPGPQDSHYLFDRFLGLIQKKSSGSTKGVR